MTTLAGSVESARPADSARANPAAESLESVDAGKVCLMRFALAFSALVIIFIDPSEPNRLVALTYSALLAYTVYSGVLYLAAARRKADFSSQVWTWVDVCCYLVFIALSSGTGSIFFYFFFFAILVASFRGGFESGMRVTVVSALLFAVVAYASSPERFELNRFLLRPVCLLLLGYMIAVWGGSEVTLKRRLAFLKRIIRTANPRFGVNQTIGTFMEEIREFYRADTCLLVTQSQETMQYFLRRADRYKADRGAVAERVANEMGCQLTSLLGDESLAVTVEEGGKGWRRVIVAGEPDESRGVNWFPTLDALALLIGDESFISVPWGQRSRSAARLYLTSRGGEFARGDVEFLRQTVEYADPIVENIQLVDRLASMAAEQERRRISLDLHDSTIQPYIGLKMGIESVCRKAAADNPLAGDLKDLLMKTEMGLGDLRRYVHGLKRDESGAEEPALSAAVRQYVEQFTRLHGVEARCDIEPGLNVSDRLSAEALQIVREGLSNVHRHTSARAAAVRLSSSDGSLVIEVENAADDGPLPRAPFTPRSIRERSVALGGRALVEVGGGRTLVRAEIPL